MPPSSSLFPSPTLRRRSRDGHAHDEERSRRFFCRQPSEGYDGLDRQTDRGRVDDWAAWPVSGIRAFTIADVATSSCCSGGIAERIKRITSSVNSGYCDADFAVPCPNCHRMLQGHAAADPQRAEGPYGFDRADAVTDVVA
jgi:hypothetical protein